MIFGDVNVSLADINLSNLTGRGFKISGAAASDLLALAFHQLAMSMAMVMTI